jgi:hypothetical protein
VTVTGSGSLWNLGGAEMNVGYATSSNHTLTVSSGGVVTNVGFLIIGYTAGDAGNSMVITNGGQFFSTGNNGIIGNAANVNSNSASIGGALNGTNAVWNLVGHSLTIGNNAAATGNWMTVTSGGVLTNASTLTLGGVGSVFSLGGQAYLSSSVTIGSSGTFTITGAGQLNNGVFAGAIVNTGAFTYASSAAQTLGGVISGTGSLTNSPTTGRRPSTRASWSASRAAPVRTVHSPWRMVRPMACRWRRVTGSGCAVT